MVFFALRQIKPEKLLSENDLQLLIVDATEQRIERPKDQRDYYSGKAHACTIKTEVVIDHKGQILRVSKPYEGRVHDFEIRKSFRLFQFPGRALPRPPQFIFSSFSNYRGYL